MQGEEDTKEKECKEERFRALCTLTIKNGLILTKFGVHIV